MHGHVIPVKMVWSRTGSLLVLVFLVSCGVQSSETHNPVSSAETQTLPLHQELCCDSPGAHFTAEESPPPHESRPLRTSQCNFRTHDSSGGLCVDVMCSIKEDWRALTCELHSDHSAFSRTATAISLQRVLSGAEGISTSEDPVICEGNSSLKCSLVLGARSSDVVLNVTIADVTLHLFTSESQQNRVTTERPLFPQGETTPDDAFVLEAPDGDVERRVLQTFGEPQILLDLDVNVNFTIEVRCSSLVDPPVWSDWSKPHYINLDIVSYIPEIVKARPGEAINIYCVFNDRNFQAKSASWILNYEESLHSSQYRPVNQWVSELTVWPSETRMYELLQCTQEYVISYSQIYVEGAAINITCQTNGDINAMDCSWKTEGWTDPKFKSRISLQCSHTALRSHPKHVVSYAVQVRCHPKHGSGYWSDWSETVYSVPQNSQAPERGPDFWRHLQTSGLSYCVDGLIIRHESLSGTVTEERVGLKSSHSFDWNQEVQTVTVETYNSLGRSAKNFNVTLNKQVKRGAVGSFHVLVVNSSCVSVSWSLLNSSSVPVFMVLQWTHSHQEIHKNSPSWRRLRYTDRPVFIRGDFFGSEEYDFYLYPVFADGEGQPVHTRAVRRDPGAYMLLMIISFLSIVLLVTLVLSQNQMKRIVWKDVPNPNKCSWAKGVDFRKVETFEHVLRSPEALPAWPLLLPNENISTVVIVDKCDLSALIQPPADPFSPEIYKHLDPQDNEKALSDHVTENTDFIHPQNASLSLNSEISDAAKDSSAQSSVNYATVQFSDPQIKHFPDNSGCSSCDEGNFSANNSDISDSSHGALWELESCRAEDSDIDKRCSGSSYNSVEELSESDQEENEKQEKDLFYLTLTRQDSEERDETQTDLLKSVVLSKESCSFPLLDADEDSGEKTELLSAASRGLSPLYLPQFRTSPATSESQL
ncbi:hypothetical protein WMY93_024552 [Mugilogobius chulae]|uniref:Leptin receptor immunoglobulin-like domain-containing protein n=1 Tax=Mugilogobius chulae TaxID=88201 RepID=A0AAW0N4H1_9GOBI